MESKFALSLELKRRGLKLTLLGQVELISLVSRGPSKREQGRNAYLEIARLAGSTLGDVELEDRRDVRADRAIEHRTVGLVWVALGNWNEQVSEFLIAARQKSRASLLGRWGSLLRRGAACLWRWRRGRYAGSCTLA